MTRQCQNCGRLANPRGCVCKSVRFRKWLCLKCYLRMCDNKEDK
jgi:hypothetical protein